MALMLGRIYKAFTSLGMDEKEARESAEELGELKIEIVKFAGEVNMLKWMVGTNVAISLAILFMILNYLVR